MNLIALLSKISSLNGVNTEITAYVDDYFYDIRKQSSESFRISGCSFILEHNKDSEFYKVVNNDNIDHIIKLKYQIFFEQNKFFLTLSKNILNINSSFINDTTNMISCKNIILNRDTSLNYILSFETNIIKLASNMTYLFKFQKNKRKLLENYPYIKFDQDNIFIIEGTNLMKVTGNVDNGEYIKSTKVYYMKTNSLSLSPTDAVYFFEEQFKGTKQFSVEIPVNNYAVGSHILYFRGIRDGSYGSVYNFNFTVKERKKLTIINKNTTKTEYKTGIDNIIEFKIKFSYEANINFSFSYGIDSLSSSMMMTISLNSNEEEKTFTISLPTLSIGDHSIKFKANAIQDYITFRIVDSSPPEIKNLTTSPSNPKLYYKGITNSISIEYQMRDADGTGIFSVYHSLDSSEFTKFSDSFSISDTSWQHKSFIISISSITPSEETVHSISFYLIDNLGKESLRQEFFFKYLINPMIRLQEEIKTTYIYQVDKSIVIKLLYRDGRGNGQFTVFLNIYDVINNKNNNNIVSSNSYSFSIDSNMEQSATITVKLDQLTYEKQYRIDIRGNNSYNEESNVIIEQFIIHLSFPVLTITTAPHSSFIKNRNESICISGHARDSNLGTVSLEYKYDDSNEFKQFYSLEIETVTESKSFTCSIPIDQTLSEGSHFLIIRAIDIYNKYHELSPYNFTFQHNTPELEIMDHYDLSKPSVYIRCFNSSLNISMKVIDYNKVESIKIYFSITNTDYCNSLYIQMKGEISQVFPLIFDIPQELPENIYFLNISASEINGKTSYIKSYPLNFTYCKPEILRYEVEPCNYIHNINSIINIKVQFRDYDSNITILKYSIDNSDNIESHLAEFNKKSLEYTTDFNSIDISYLSDGYHSLYLIAVDRDGKLSNIINFSFNYYVPPNITISTIKINMNQFKHNLDTKIHLTVQFKYIPNKEFTFNYSIIGTSIFNTDKLNLSSEIETLQYSIDIGSLGINTYTLSCVAITKDSNQETTILNFAVVDSASPEIVLQNSTQNQYEPSIFVKGINDTIILSINVKDEDSAGSLIVKYYLDNNLDQIHETRILHIVNNSYQNIVLNINLSIIEPSDGNHNICIFAVDNLGKNSTSVYYFFKYIKNKPEIRLINEIQSSLLYNVNRTINIIIKYI